MKRTYSKKYEWYQVAELHMDIEYFRWIVLDALNKQLNRNDAN